MDEILSQGDIAALLTGLRQQENTPKGEKEKKRVKRYDFRRPDKFSKDQLRTLQMLHENLARGMGGDLSAHLRAMVEIDLLTIDQTTYAEFVKELPTPSVMAAFSMPPLGGRGVLQLGIPTCLAMIERLFGGVPKGSAAAREMTEIEQTVIKRVLVRMMRQLGEAWENVAKVQPKLEFVEYNPHFAQVAPPSEMVIWVTNQIQIGDHKGKMNLVLPHTLLEQILPKLTAYHWFSSNQKSPDEGQQQEILANLQRAYLPLTAILGETRITVEELLDLEVGDVLPLETKVGEELVIHLGRRPRFIGRPGTVGSKLGVEITRCLEEGDGSEYE